MDRQYVWPGSACLLPTCVHGHACATTHVPPHPQCIINHNQNKAQLKKNPALGQPFTSSIQVHLISQAVGLNTQGSQAVGLAQSLVSNIPGLKWKIMEQNIAKGKVWVVSPWLWTFQSQVISPSGISSHHSDCEFDVSKYCFKKITFKA